MLVLRDAASDQLEFRPIGAQMLAWVEEAYRTSLKSSETLARIQERGGLTGRNKVR